MHTIEQDNFFFRQIAETDKDGKTILKEYPILDFIYGYRERKGQKIPALTLCVIPFTNGGAMFFAIGLAYCSEKDQVEKARGRKIAEARARASINIADGNLLLKLKNGTIRWKINHKTDDISDGHGRLCGLCMYHEDTELLPDVYQQFELNPDETSRLTKSFAFLSKLLTVEFA